MKKENNSIELKHDVEKIVGRLLRYGVLIASLVVLTGGILYLSRFGQHIRPAYHLFKGEEDSLTTFKGIFLGVFSLDPKAVIQFGVLLLIITPILRIVFSLFAFAWERDKLYVGITLFVLAIILFSTFGGLKI